MVDHVTDPTTRAEMLIWCRKGLLDVVAVADSLAIARRIETEAAGSEYLVAASVLAQIVDHLRGGEIEHARRQTSRYAAIAETTGAELHRFVSMTNEAMWDRRGRLEDAVALVEAAAPIGSVSVA